MGKLLEPQGTPLNTTFPSMSKPFHDKMVDTSHYYYPQDSKSKHSHVHYYIVSLVENTYSHTRVERFA